MIFPQGKIKYDFPHTQNFKKNKNPRAPARPTDREKCKIAKKQTQKERAETVLSFHIQNGNFCFYFVDLT